MKNKILFVSLILILFIGINTSKAFALKAKITALPGQENGGQVSIKPNANSDFIIAKVGDIIEEDGIIATGKGANSIIELLVIDGDSKSVIRLSSNTYLKLNKVQNQVKLALDKGKILVQNKEKSNLNVTVGNRLATVEGYTYYVKAIEDEENPEEMDVEVEVVEGIVVYYAPMNNKDTKKNYILPGETSDFSMTQDPNGIYNVNKIKHSSSKINLNEPLLKFSNNNINLNGVKYNQNLQKNGKLNDINFKRLQKTIVENKTEKTEKTENVKYKRVEDKTSENKKPSKDAQPIIFNNEENNNQEISVPNRPKKPSKLSREAKEQQELNPPQPPPIFDPDNLPENFDPDNLPENFNPDNLPENFNPDNLPENFNPDNLPENFNPDNLPNNFNPGNLPNNFNPGNLPNNFNPPSPSYQSPPHPPRQPPPPRPPR